MKPDTIDKAAHDRISEVMDLTTLADYWLIQEFSKNGDAFFKQDPAYPGQQYRTYTLLDGAADRIKAAISDICISMKAEDYLTLPDYVEDIVPVELDAKAAKAYRKLEREMLLEVDDQMVTAGSAAVLNGKLLHSGLFTHILIPPMPLSLV